MYRDEEVWAWSSTGAKMHAFKSDGNGRLVALCRSSIVRGGMAALVSRKKAQSVCASCLKKWEAACEREEASMMPATEADDLGYVAPVDERETPAETGSYRDEKVWAWSSTGTRTHAFKDDGAGGYVALCNDSIVTSQWVTFKTRSETYSSCTVCHDKWLSRCVREETLAETPARHNKYRASVRFTRKGETDAMVWRFVVTASMPATSTYAAEGRVREVFGDVHFHEVATKGPLADGDEVLL